MLHFNQESWRAGRYGNVSDIPGKGIKVGVPMDQTKVKAIARGISKAMKT